MKESPILFNGTMIRAQQEGRKTQTRRTCKFNWSGSLEKLMHQSTFDPAYKCPYGKPGDRLWIRETWRMDAYNIAAEYRASTSALMEHIAPWSPSIHMPRWASRITLEIVSVRVERLNDITEEDAKAEGVEECGGFMTASGCWKNYGSDGPSFWSPALSYRSLWESINGPGSWDLNPLVWVIEYKEVKP